MDEIIYDRITSDAGTLHVDFSGKELAALAVRENFGEDQLQAVGKVFDYMAEKKHSTVIQTLLKLSRLPLKDPKTFDNYDFSRIHGQDAEALKKPSALSEVYSGANIAFIGPSGVGKTHLAEAYGYKCCQAGMKAYFLKASELNDKFTAARKDGRESRVITSLVKPACLIIDEIGRCHFDHENTMMFFDMIDRRYAKESPSTMIFTSNRQPSQWEEFFDGKDDLLATLDRIFDRARVFMIKGESYRGRECQTLAVEAGTANENLK